MPRVQAQYQGSGERPQLAGIPMVQAEQARRDPNYDGGFQLARALGALPIEQTGALAQNAYNAKASDDRRAAETYANGLTVEELGKQVKDGSLLPSKSPTFIAALQHIYGENSQATIERDTLSKIQTGELKFGSPQEMDKYITDARNGALTGQSEYTVAGFDKGYNTFREKAMNANTQVANQAAVEHGLQESSDNLGNVLLQVTAPEFKGDAAQTLVNRYQLLRKTSLLRDDAAKEALSGLVASIAGSGNVDLTAALLGKQLDNGVTVKGVLGDIKATGFSQHAEQMNDKNQRQRVDVELRPFLDQADKGELDQKALDSWTTKNEKYVTTATLHAITSGNRAAQERQLRELQKAQLVASSAASVAQATQLTQAAIRTGNLAFLPEQKVQSPTGEITTFNTKEAAQRIIEQDVQAQKMPVGKATEYWATNNVENPEWQKQIQAGASNIASIGWNYDGKSIGQLNPQGQAAIDTFMRINTTHPAYAQKLVASDKDYKKLSDIQFLVEKGGFPNVNDAAAVVNKIERADIKPSDYGTMSKNVQSAVDEVVNPHFYSGTAAWWNGLWGNSEVNVTSMQSDIRRRAELLVMSGQVGDAKAAVKSTVEYLSNPSVTTKINNTLYYNKDLPPLPASHTSQEWMEKFITDNPGLVAKSQQLKGDVRLAPNSDGGFTSWVGGVPLHDANGQVVNYSKEDISRWADEANKHAIFKADADANYQLWKGNERRKLGETLKKMGQQGQHFDALDGVNSELYSRATYERLLHEGKIKQGQ